MSFAKTALRAITSVVAAAVLTMTLSSCSDAKPTSSVTPVNYKACLLADKLGLADHSLNGASYQGLLQAQAEFGISIKAVEVKTNAVDADYAKGVQKLIAAKCDLVIGVGESAKAIEDAAVANPKVLFEVVKGVPYELGSASLHDVSALTNVRVISFDSAQAGFLAGYLAADHTKTGVVAAFGSSLNETEIALLAGFYQGVKHYSGAYSKGVRILGSGGSDSDAWVTATVGSATAAQALSAELISENADVIFPVIGDANSGGAGLGALESALDSDSVVVIGSVTSWHTSALKQPLGERVLASALIATQTSVANSIEVAMNDGGNLAVSQVFVGSVENSAVAISEARDISYSNRFLSDLPKITNLIKQGVIKVSSRLAAFN